MAINSLLNLSITSSVDDSSWIDLGDEKQQEPLLTNEISNIRTALEFKIGESFYSILIANKTDDVSSGKVMYNYLPRMESDFIINGKNISTGAVKRLYEKHASLIVKNENGSQNYHLLLKQVFLELFKHNATELTSPIIEELITNCNQAGYDGALHIYLNSMFEKYNLQLMSLSKKELNINFNSSDHLNIKYCVDIPVLEQEGHTEVCKLNAVLEFTLEAQNSKKDVIYKDGKILLDIPKELKNYYKDLISDIENCFSDDSIVDSLYANFAEGPKSFVIDQNDDALDEQSFESMLNLKMIIKALNKAKEDSFKELDKIVQNMDNNQPIFNYHDEEEKKLFKDFCKGFLNLGEKQHIRNILLKHEPQAGETSKHYYYLSNIAEEQVDIPYLLTKYLNNCYQYLRSSVLSEQVNEAPISYRYLLHELILLAIAADDKLTEKYNDVLFNKKNLALLPILVGGKKYIEIFTEKFSDLYRDLKNKIILLVDGRIGLFSAIALRQDKIYDKLFIDYIPQYLREVLCRSALGYNEACDILDSTSSVQNTELIRVILNSIKEIEKSKLVKSRPGISSTFLQFAVQFDRINTTRIILNYKTDDTNAYTKADYTQVLHFAIMYGHSEIVQLLIEKGATATDEILGLAIKINKGHIENQQGVSEDKVQAHRAIVQFLTARYQSTSKSRLLEQEDVLDNNNQKLAPVTRGIKEDFSTEGDTCLSESKISEEKSIESNLIQNDDLSNQSLEFEDDKLVFDEEDSSYLNVTNSLNSLNEQESDKKENTQ